MIDHEALIARAYQLFLHAESCPSKAFRELVLAYGRAVELETWEAAAQRFELAFERNEVVQDVLDDCRKQGA